jgi:hypothetical protein
MHEPPTHGFGLSLLSSVPRKRDSICKSCRLVVETCCNSVRVRTNRGRLSRSNCSAWVAVAVALLPVCEI